MEDIDGGVGGGCKKVRSEVRVNAAERGNCECTRHPSHQAFVELLGVETLKMNNINLSFQIDNSFAMAAIRAPSSTFLSAFLPIVRAQLFPASTQPITKRLPLLQRLRASATLAIPVPAALLPIPSLLSDLWDGILNAVPKKKTSHMKKRHRQMAAGKHLRDVTALNKCSACGRAKRAHVLCPFCVQSESLPHLMEMRYVDTL